MFAYAVSFTIVLLSFVLILVSNKTHWKFKPNNNLVIYIIYNLKSNELGMVVFNQVNQFWKTRKIWTKSVAQKLIMNAQYSEMKHIVCRIIERVMLKELYW